MCCWQVINKMHCLWFFSWHSSHCDRYRSQGNSSIIPLSFTKQNGPTQQKDKLKFLLLLWKLMCVFAFLKLRNFEQIIDQTKAENENGCSSLKWNVIVTLLRRDNEQGNTCVLHFSSNFCAVRFLAIPRRVQSDWKLWHSY